MVHAVTKDNMTILCLWTSEIVLDILYTNVKQYNDNVLQQTIQTKL